MSIAYKCDISGELAADEFPIFLPDGRKVFIGNETREYFGHINLCGDCAMEIQKLLEKRSGANFRGKGVFENER